MPIALSQKQRIHYRIEGDRGPFLLLYPPFLEGLLCWYRAKYIERLQDYYRLILLDPVGHGRSDYSLALEHYTLESRAQHVLDIMEELKVEKFHFLGMGMGAQVGFFMAAHFPSRLRSLVTAGAHPYAITTEMQKFQEWIQQLRSDEISVFLESFKTQELVSPEREAEILKGSPEAYALSLEAISQWKGIGQDLNSISIPGLLITATGEEKFLSIREAGRKMPRARYLILPELRYNDGLLEAELVVPELMDFIRKLRRSE
ncbi:MAG: alpha/beta fold hydrolase [SAR324 cluster bacterium]|nr:alpha/beta fold hydrolase [SAR324 cluster bacterium]